MGRSATACMPPGWRRSMVFRCHSATRPSSLACISPRRCPTRNGWSTRSRTTNNCSSNQSCLRTASRSRRSGRGTAWLWPRMHEPGTPIPRHNPCIVEVINRLGGARAMSKIVRAEAYLCDIAVETKRTDAIQAFVKQETIFVEIETDDGITGTGYSYTIGTGGRAVLQLLRTDLIDLLLGEDA